MAKQLNVNLNVSANTRDAKKNLEDLSSILNKISVSTKLNIDDQSLREAKKAATDLEHHLNNAVNVETGKLDLNKFSQSLSKSGQSLQSLHNQLTKIGPDGQQAFLRLAQSIAQADSSALNLGSKLTQLGTTLKNTARWQISSSILHGFMGMLQSAYGYAQDLNESLNNIRIVTGQSIDDMARFADEANRAAKSLSATTTAYTDAALIYYQQGLDDKAVKERTETTIKLANVSRQSAEEVSSQMTAIWNNFDDGSKSLEYYADVITKLGAATASSSDEIAQGLQKFASVADTVGLSYEKATAALATVVAETRQSADVVGTAFKTMFARFQGLQLGETLEDGVTLNKYSEAINTVGVNILKANGDLKDMDTILDELGEKWNSIGEAQKVALAETVAGTRQYAQFMAIMNNYDKILANQNIASGAEGTLQQQADIYAESWEAASKRVRAAAQGIYQDLIDDKFFITALNGLEKFIGTIDGAIKGIGGLKTILLAIGSIIASKYATEMPAIMQKLVGNFNVLTGAAEKQRIAMIADTDQIIQNINATESGSKAFEAQVSAMKIASHMTTELERRKNSLSKAEIEAYQQKIKEVELYGQMAAAIGAEIDALKEEAALQSVQINSSLYSSGNLSTSQDNIIVDPKSIKQVESCRNQIKLLEDELNNYYTMLANGVSDSDMTKLSQRIPQIQQELKKLYDQIDQLGESKTGHQLVQDFKNAAEKAGQFNTILNQALLRTKSWRAALDSGDKSKIAQVNQEVKAYVEVMEKAGIDTKAFKNEMGEINTNTFLKMLEDQTSELWGQLYDTNTLIDNLKTELQNLNVSPEALDKIEITMRKLGATSPQLISVFKQLSAASQEANVHTVTLSESLTRVGSIAMSMSMVFNAFKNIGNIFSDDSLSTGEKLVQLLTAIGMLLPAINSVLSQQNLQWARNTIETIFNTKAKKAAAAAAAQQAAAEGAATGATVASTVATKGLTAALGALWTAVWPLLAIVGAMAAVAGGIVLITNAIKDFYATKPEGQLEKSKKATKELATAADEAKQSYEDLKSTFDQYDSVVQTLEECREGTEEWNKALKDVNDTVLEIIRNNPDLAGKIETSRDKNGRLIINNADAILTEAQKRSQVAGNAQLLEQIREQQLEAEVQKRNFMNSQNMVAPIKQQILSNLSEYRGLSPKEFEEKIGGTHGLSETAFTNFYNSVQDLADATEEAANSVKNTSELMVENILGDNYSITDKEKALNYLDSWKQQERDRLLEENSKINIYSGKNNADVQNLWQQYSKASHTDYELAGNAIVGTDNNRSFQYINEEGKPTQISLEEMISTIIASGIEDALTNYVEENITQKAWKKDLQGIIPVEQIQQDIADYNKELKKLKFGDIIQPELFDTLSEQVQSYFQIMEDGTYKLIGSAEQLQDILFKESTANFDKNLFNYNNFLNDSSTYLTEEEELATNMARSVGQINSEQVMRQSADGTYSVFDVSAEMEKNAIGYAMATESIEQLEYVKQRLYDLNVNVESQTLAESAALQDLATKYESCADDLEAYQHALSINNDELAIAAKKTLEYSIRVAELAEKHGFDAKETEAYAKRLKKNLADGFEKAGFNQKQLEKSALTAAIANQRLDRGLTNLNENLDEYKKNLIGTNQNTVEWSNTMDSLKTDLADILNMDMSVFTDEFALDLLTDANKANVLKMALDGDISSIKTLREWAADNVIVEVSARLPDEEIDGFKTKWDNLKAAMAENLETGGLDQTALLNSFNDLIEQGHMTKSEIEATLSGMHVAADIETTYNQMPQEVPITITDEEVEVLEEAKDGKPARYRKKTKTYSGGVDTVDAWVPTYSIKGTTGPGTATVKTRQSSGMKSRVSTTGSALPPTSPTGTPSPNDLADMVLNNTVDETIAAVKENSSWYYSTDSSGLTPQVDAFSPLSNENENINLIQVSPGSTTTGLTEDKSGGSEKEPTKAVELTKDEEHRYDELNKTLEGLTQQFERLGKARERAWGKNKITLLEQEITKLKQMQQVYERYLKTVAGDDWNNLSKVLQNGGNLGAIIASGKAGGNLQKDFNKIVSSVAGAIQYKIKDENGNESRKTEDWKGLKDTLGIDFDLMLDEFGQIANRDEIEEAIESWWNKNVETWNNMTAVEQQNNPAYWDQLSAIKEYMEKLLNQYDESINTFTEQSDKLLDNLYEQQAKVYEHFRYKVDLKIEISERSLKRIEYAIKVLGDNIYKVPEIMRSWFDKRVTDTKAEVINQGSTWASAYQEAQSLYSSGQISQEDYVQTIKDAQDGLYGCVDALLEINEEMREYYKNVLSKVKDEMSRITNEMDHQLNTVKHLTNVLSLLGRETDYEAIGKILDAQLQMSRNGYEVSKAQTEMARRQLADAEAILQGLLADGISEAALEEWKNAVLYPAKEALLEAESEMQADFEAYLEVINSIYENRINQIYQDSERRLSGAWGSFDQVNNALERQHALDDEYLTKTNQIYETNVLIKKLAEDLDKTNNDAAKLRIKNFSAEIEGLQQKNKLSKSELDIAKARYEVLLAEIALEDARNAKSTVRLQRDNEGNYGYVYTADGEQVDAAEDDLAKKNNDLYNLVLGQANDYTQKIIQLTQERNAALKDLDMAWAEGRIADEETYNKLREDINNKYNALIQEDYESYYRALYWLDQTAVTDHTEAWGTSFQDVLDAGEDFKNETDTLMHETGETIDWLNGMRQEATEEAKVGAGELEQQLDDLTKQNDALAKTMIEEVIPASEETLTMAQALTEEWIRQYDEIMALIDAYLQLIDAMNAALNEMAGVNKEEFDANKDYSLAATQKFLETGVIDNDVIQQLLFRAQKEELNGGHNDKWWTNDQILELMDIASRGDNDARSADAIAFLQGIAGVNGDQQYYTSDRLAELGITGGEDYSLEKFAEKLEENTKAQTDANRLAEEARAQAESTQEATEESAEKTGENTEQSANTAQSIQDTATGIIEDSQALADETTGHFDETTQEAENIIQETSNNLINALDQNANIVSAAVQAAAQVIALSISQAAEYAARAEAAAAEAQAAAAESIGGAEGLASGGYTGAWGSSGKLAVLHEKELVLNANDTENILSAISLVRDFASAIDLRAAASNISTGLSSPAYEAGSQTLEQSVTIHAEFPNATNHSEIEEAFNNLVNRASQYANRS